MNKLLCSLLLICSGSVYAEGEGKNELLLIRDKGCKISANLVLFGSQGKEDGLSLDTTVTKIKRNVRGYESLTPDMIEIVNRGYNGAERGQNAFDLEYARCLDRYPIN